MRIDLNSNRVLASIWYWNYGDYNPISPPSLRLPERRSRITGFEFVNSTQGGKNCLIYGMPTTITQSRRRASTSTACATTARRCS